MTRRSAFHLVFFLSSWFIRSSKATTYLAFFHILCFAPQFFNVLVHTPLVYISAQTKQNEPEKKFAKQKQKQE